MNKYSVNLEFYSFNIMQDDTRTQLGFKLQRTALFVGSLDSISEYSIASINSYGNCNTYKDKSNVDFAVISDFNLNDNIIRIDTFGDTKVKLTKDVCVGDTICEYRVMKLIKKRRICQYKKRLIALENGKVGDVVDARFETWSR